MTPGQRGNYLSWLASGKQGQLDDIGYAFVYFYGLNGGFSLTAKMSI
jgi:hypothetical protein